MNKIIISISIYNLAKDLCDGFEDIYNVDNVAEVLTEIVADGLYSVDELWDMNDKDSTLVYDILSYYIFKFPC